MMTERLDRIELQRRIHNGEKLFSRLDISEQDFKAFHLGFGDCLSFDFCNFNGSDFSGAQITRCMFSNCQFRKAVFREALLEFTDFRGCDLWGAELTGVTIRLSTLIESFLGAASLRNSFLEDVSFEYSAMCDTDFRGTSLAMAKLFGVREATDELYIKANLSLDRTESPAVIIDDDTLKYTGAVSLIRAQVLARLDISEISVDPFGPLDDLADFLTLTKFPSEKIKQFRDYCSQQQTRPSVFISYCTRDLDAVKFIHKMFSQTGIPVWFAPSEMEAGRTVSEQLNTAIDRFTYVVPILSSSSINSSWVAHEIVRSKAREKLLSRRIVYPVRICAYEELANWRLLDPESGIDIASDFKNEFIPDFSNYSEPAAMRNEFLRLSRQLELI